VPTEPEILERVRAAARRKILFLLEILSQLGTSSMGGVNKDRDTCFAPKGQQQTSPGQSEAPPWDSAFAMRI